MSAQPLEVSLATLEGAYLPVGDRLNSVDHRLNSIDYLPDGFEPRVELRFQSLESKIDGRVDALRCG